MQLWSFKSERITLNMNHESRIKNSRLGFTLIELLIVIVIIGILAALLMSNFVLVRQRARDGQRKSDLRQIQSALELYRADQSTYPTGTSGTIPCITPITYSGTTYMQKVPCDPLGPTPYTYITPGINVCPTSASYCLITCLENGADPQRDENNGLANNSTACPTTAPAIKSYTLMPP